MISPVLDNCFTPTLYRGKECYWANGWPGCNHVPCPRWNYTLMTFIQINRDQLIEDLSAMIRCPSVNSFGTATQPGAEAAMADLYEYQMRQLDLEIGTRTVEPGRRNVWGTLKGSGSGPTVLLVGHLDTVGVDTYTEPFMPKVENGHIYGRGSCDMKAGLSAYLEVVRYFKRSGTLPRGDLILAGVVDEEHAMIGSKDFGKNGPKVDCAIVAEPSSLGISANHKGQMLMTIKTKGLAAHSSMPSSGRNAVYHMATVLKALQGYAEDLSSRHPNPICGSPSFSVGVIRGGDNACSVPDFCEIDIDRRTIPGETSASVIAEITAVLEAAKRTEPALDYKLGPPFLDLPPLDTSPESCVMQAIVFACETVIGEAKIYGFPGSTDAPNFGCPTIICGPGELAQCHSLNEYVSIDQIEDAVRIYIHAILKMNS